MEALEAHRAELMQDMELMRSNQEQFQHQEMEMYELLQQNDE